MTDDLLPTNPGATIPGGEPLADALRTTTEEAASLKHRLDECRVRQKLLEDLISYRDKGWGLHLKALCDREADRLRRMREAADPSIGAIEELYREAQAQSKHVPTTMPSDIERLAASMGLAIDRKSRHPRYFFEKDGFIEARIDDQKLTATISTREGKINTLPADPDAILEAVGSESKRLFGRKFSGSRFLGEVRKAYLAAIKAKRTARDGDPVPLREVYAQIAKRSKGYRRDEFLVDLSALVEQGPAETSGYKFDLQQTKDTQEGILLLGAAGRGMVNLILFKKSNSTPP